MKDLADGDLAELAKDYRWLDEEARAEEERREFRRRREAIVAECERRGMAGAADACRAPDKQGARL
ncbi:MAG TPA: hypothetical protein VGF59_26475 [Bryobacteraceae bacterium]